MAANQAGKLRAGKREKTTAGGATKTTNTKERIVAVAKETRACQSLIQGTGGKLPENKRLLSYSKVLWR